MTLTIGRSIADFALDGFLNDLALSPDGTTLALAMAGFDAGVSIRCRDLAGNRVLGEAVRPLSIVAVGFCDQHAVWSLQDAEAEEVLTIDTLDLRAPRVVARFPRGLGLRRAGYDPPTGRWAVQGRSLFVGTIAEPPQRALASIARGASFVASAFVEDGLIVSGAVEGFAVRRDGPDLAEVSRWPVPSGRSFVPRVSSAARAVLFSADDGAGNLLFDLDTGERLAPTVFAPNDRFWQPAFTRDGAWIIGMTPVRVLCFPTRDESGGTTLLAEGHGRPVAIAMAADADVVAFGWERRVRVFDLPSR